MPKTTEPLAPIQDQISPQYINIAAYKFVCLDRLPELRAQLLELSRSLGLKGTILISREGVNMFVAGGRKSIDQLIKGMANIHPAFDELTIKESVSDYQPFSRMLVRIKREIISMGVPTIRPEAHTSPKISARQLKEWLDEGRDVTLLDTRNDYEVDLGTFDNAVPIGIDHFRSFPDAVDQLPEEMRQKPIVMFCTGGIRCEKAGPLMEEKGFNEVYQLDGGILKYFEDCGGAHYHGECFVFDKRVALDPHLNETGTEQCYACQAIVTKADQESEKYVPGVSCPVCYLQEEERMARLVSQRNTQLKQLVDPLPGSEPYDNMRPLNVPLKYDQHPLIDFLFGLHSHLGREYWLAECANARIIHKEQLIAADTIVRSGWRIEHLLPQTVEPDVDGNIRVVHEDESFIVVNKPAPLPMHPCGRFNRNSLIYILSQLYPGQRLRMAHRLDANTTGVVVICRKRVAADWMRTQFESDKVAKYYLARIHGHPSLDSFSCEAPISDGPRKSGHRIVEAGGLEASTDFRVLEKCDDGTAIVECRPRTGRTNQIRIHLWHLGMPIVGDPCFLVDGEIIEGQTKAVQDSPMCLHAATIEFDHPVTRKRVSFSVDRPAWKHRVIH